MICLYICNRPLTGIQGGTIYIDRSTLETEIKCGVLHITGNMHAKVIVVVCP